MKQKVSILGLGYIGLPTAVFLAKVNAFEVYGLDKSLLKLNQLKKNKLKLFEKPLNNLINRFIKTKKIKLKNTITPSDFFVICVPTPIYLKKKQHKADLKFVNQAVDEILKVLKVGDTIILESTVPVGTSEQICKKIIDAGFKSEDINFAYCPERVLPGNIYKELINNDRVVGGINNKSKKIVSNFYKKFVKGKIHMCDAHTAEMCKLVENSYRDTNIAFANEISMICDDNKINTTELIKLANKHPRVNILNPGCGVGGHCIAIDPYFLIEKNPKKSNLIKTARKVNIYKTGWVEKKIESKIKKFKNKNKKTPEIAYLGLSYKPNSADLRGSPALEIAKKLNNKYKILFVDPHISKIKNLNIVNLNYA
ncbi:nucleotide sugar dehydrogenase, partial [Candidatus Pelagibacter sp.]|nr:nucleotide sugar dehydrogenase [Candidatus Pelagibacter sp.]